MKKSTDEIRNLLESRSAAERGLGLALVGKIRCYDAIGHCVMLLRDRDSDVRERAAWALDQLCSPQTVPALIEAMTDTSFGVRSNAGWALVHIAQRTIPELVVPDVIDVLSDSRNEDARQMAYLVLQYIGGDAAQAAIEQYWKQ